jgi:hypothetical protein
MPRRSRTITLTARGREGTVGFTTIDCFGTAEESTIGAEQVSQVGSHVSNLEGQNTLRVTTTDEICGQVEQDLLQPDNHRPGIDRHQSKGALRS